MYRTCPRYAFSAPRVQMKLMEAEDFFALAKKHARSKAVRVQQDARAGWGGRALRLESFVFCTPSKLARCLSAPLSRRCHHLRPLLLAHPFSSRSPFCVLLSGLAALSAAPNPPACAPVRRSGRRKRRHHGLANGDWRRDGGRCAKDAPQPRHRPCQQFLAILKLTRSFPCQQLTAVALRLGSHRFCRRFADVAARRPQRHQHATAAGVPSGGGHWPVAPVTALRRHSGHRGRAHHLPS